MDDEGSSSKRARVVDASYDSGEDESKFTKGTWSKEEDDKLIEAVTAYGTDNWKAVAAVVVGRSAKQCRDRYKLKLDPTINHGPWTKTEDDRLLELAAEYGRAWTKIARNMPGRTENAVKSRISSLERSRTKDWAADEDALLTELRKSGVHFDQMVKHFPTRSSHAIKKRWETLHMDELTRKLKQDLNPTAQQSHQSQQTSMAEAARPQPMAPTFTNQQQQVMGGSGASSTLLAYPSMGSPLPMMVPSFNNMMPMMQMPNNQKMPQLPVHPAVNSSRLVRHSTSMTVLLQVLGSADMPGMLSSSPLRPRESSTLREHNSFSLPGPTPSNQPSDQASPSPADGETPGQQFLKYLISSEKTGGDA